MYKTSKMKKIINGTLFIFQMLMDPMGGIVMTNDGNAILREVCNIYNVHCLKNSYNY